MAKYVIAHDVGTSSVKTALVNEAMQVLTHHTTGYSFLYPQPGWVEQNPEDYWNAAVTNTRKVIAQSGISRNDILGIVFSTQAMGIIPIDKNGSVLHTNITWVDGRAEDQAQWLMNKIGGRRIFKALVGIEITGKDVVAKLRWLKEKRSEVYDNARYMLDVNGYLKYKATGKATFEWSGACSYGFNLKRKDWEHMLFKAAGIDVNKFAPLVRSTDRVGTLTPEAAKEMDLPQHIAVYGGCDDTQSAAMGSGASEEGEAHIYLGTSAWAAVSTARNLKHKNGAVCLQSANPTSNLVVGITESAGANFEWMIEHFYKEEKKGATEGEIYELINRETDSIPYGSDHLIFTPWLLGERCPVSSTTTRGTIFNIGLEHSRAHMINALLEGIGFNLKWIFQNLERDFKFKVEKIRAIGGGSVNHKWMQGIANITGKKVETIEQPKMAGAIGVSSCVWVGSGHLKSFSELSQMIKVAKVYHPQPEHEQLLNDLFVSYQELYSELKRVYDRINRKRFQKS
ncbi:hypothetical protein EMN47_20065 [Prolixibacteraceae bacterium JC049]|nr:hypothetical protein [Prolixibacteraceae bacterium JC049]